MQADVEKARPGHEDDDTATTDMDQTTCQTSAEPRMFDTCASVDITHETCHTEISHEDNPSENILSKEPSTDEVVLSVDISSESILHGYCGF